MKKIYSLIALIVAFLALGAIYNLTQKPMVYQFQGVLNANEIENKIARIKTDKGDIVFELFADTAPITVSNFVYLADNDYYDGLTFHRREEGFVIQGGDLNGNGTGGPGYEFEDELDDDYSYERGIVAMANAGPNTNGSQFFIMLDDVPLPKLYSIFGRVIEGMDVVDDIAIGDKMNNVSIEQAQ
jgi:cyclophilin family peptidyl-prolyl cis-trans isomerase